MTYDENTVLTIGTHKDKALKNVPLSYLRFKRTQLVGKLANEEVLTDVEAALLDYINENLCGKPQ